MLGEFCSPFLGNAQKMRSLVNGKREIQSVKEGGLLCVRSFRVFSSMGIELALPWKLR